MRAPFRLIIIFLNIQIIISSISFCTKDKKAPENINIDNSKIISPIKYNGKNYDIIQVGNKIFLNDTTVNKITSATTGLYVDSTFCPDDFKIPIKSDYESLLSELGSNAYSVLTDKNGFNMQEGNYYLTNTKGASGYNKIFLHIEGNSLQFSDKHPFNVKGVVKCILDITKEKLVLPFTNRDANFNEKINIENSFSKYMNGYLWKINEKITKTEKLEYTFINSGTLMIEFWGKFGTGLEIYLCDYIYVNKKSITSSQTFNELKIKTIETNFSILYSNQLNFIHSNCPIATKNDGGYYIAVSDIKKYLYVLSYDKDDNLMKSFNTSEKAYPHDITATDYGFAIYMIDADNSYHSYINLYNKNYELINTVTIMNNNANDNKAVDSNLEKQIIKYDSSGSPVFGMRFMYRPDNGKLMYSRGRIFLIFAHYNYFIDNGGHTGDTITTFNEILLDMDFGITWGASHSLIQSVTFDENYFWTAALSDAYPEGIKVEYTSKKDFTSEYDPVNKKYNSRVSRSNSDLAGYIKGYHSGPADGKLGGILYFEKYKLYCLVYAKTPNYSEDTQKNGKNIIFITTWKFENNAITNNKTYEIKVFSTGNVMQLRAGKYGDNQIFIIYAETNSTGNNGYGNVEKGTIPKVYIVRVSDMKIIISDKKYDKLLMNTNEDLRTFRDGVLIWGTANKEGKLVINKIGTPLLNSSYEDINEIITKDDIDKIKEEINENKEEDKNPTDEEENYSLSGGAIAGIIIGCIFGLVILVAIIYYLFKRFKVKNTSYSGGYNYSSKKGLLTKNYY